MTADPDDMPRVDCKLAWYPLLGSDFDFDRDSPFMSWLRYHGRH